MRFSIVAAVAALSSTALAQDLSQLPQCAKNCFGNNLGNCGATDIACVCGNAPVINSVSCCVFANCSQADIASTIAFASSLCKLVNVNVNTAPACPSGSSALPSASGASNATTSGSSVTGSASRTPTGSASGQASSGVAPYQTAAAGYGLGMVMAGMLAAL